MSFPKSLGVKHVKTIGIIVAFHSFIYAIGYIFGIGGFVDTLLYQDVASLIRPELFGWALLGTSLSIMLGYFVEHTRTVTTASTIQSFVWLFGTFVYMLNAQWLVALAIAGVWTLLSAYTGFAWRNRHRESDEWIVQNYLDM